MDEIEVNKTQRLLRIFGLKPGTKYNVKVYAKTSKGYGSPSPDILIITKVKGRVNVILNNVKPMSLRKRLLFELQKIESSLFVLM